MVLHALSIEFQYYKVHLSLNLWDILDLLSLIIISSYWCFVSHPGSCYRDMLPRRSTMGVIIFLPTNTQCLFRNLLMKCFRQCWIVFLCMILLSVHSYDRVSKKIFKNRNIAELFLIYDIFTDGNFYYTKVKVSKKTWQDVKFKEKPHRVALLNMS